MCRGCHGTFDSDKLSTASVFCLDCKRALDRIYGIAKAQGKSAQTWLSATREDAEGVFHTLRNYYSKTGRPMPGEKKKRGGDKWDVLEYMEVCRASTGTLTESVGKMMWKRQYLEFAESTAGGKLSTQQAERQWLDWEAQSPLRAAVFDLGLELAHRSVSSSVG